ncbi:hypothetical protein GCM10022226_74500 [Sphaerisporangium flaviroseum]|uniref:Uncharacterized protein n=1 Tax=Sphaerisporangium flaviroseum TaxID=509199 RepID=A0ABP7JCJ4_9ACTN
MVSTRTLLGATFPADCATDTGEPAATLAGAAPTTTSPDPAFGTTGAADAVTGGGESSTPCTSATLRIGCPSTDRSSEEPPGVDGDVRSAITPTLLTSKARERTANNQI